MWDINHKVIQWKFCNLFSTHSGQHEEWTVWVLLWPRFWGALWVDLFFDMWWSLHYPTDLCEGLSKYYALHWISYWLFVSRLERERKKLVQTPWSWVCWLRTVLYIHLHAMQWHFDVQMLFKYISSTTKWKRWHISNMFLSIQCPFSRLNFHSKGDDLVTTWQYACSSSTFFFKFS